MKLLLSVRPEYSERIFAGEKKYEFRKQKPRLTIDIVFIYESSPTKSIVGWFGVERIHYGSPEEIWGRCEDSSGIKRNDYFAYCNGTKVIYAFEINEAFRFDNPINPFGIVSDFKPPQSFTYLDDSRISKALQNSKKCATKCQMILSETRQ